MRIQNNIMAMNTHRMYTTNNSNVSRSAEKLSSGYRINRAGDDAAGLAISEKMRAQVRGLNMASKNSQDAISLIQTAEGALQEVHSMLQRMNELANQAATGTNQTFDRQQIDAEFNQLKNEINDISEQTTFNNMKLLDGSLSSGAAGVEVDSTSAMAVGKTIGTAPSTFTITAQTGLSSQKGSYAITASGNSITVAFTDAATNNVTNTTINLAKATSGDFKAGGAFKLDLSAAGMGVFEMTAVAGATVDASTLATALTSATALVTTAPKTTTDVAISGSAGFTAYAGSTTAPAGEYKLAATGTTLTVTNENGATATATLVADTNLNLTNLTFSDGTSANLGTFTAAAASTTAAQVDLLNGKTITASGSSVGNEGALKIQVGANEGEQLSISVEKMNSKGLGVESSNISDQEAAGKAITATQTAINSVSEQRATLGAMQNRLEHKIANLDNTSENLSSAESRIRDVDIAKEMTNYTKNNILSQASTAMLAQANAAPQNVLSLLQ